MAAPVALRKTSSLKGWSTSRTWVPLVLGRWVGWLELGRVTEGGPFMSTPPGKVIWGVVSTLAVTGTGGPVKTNEVMLPPGVHSKGRSP
eukprot:5912923-Pyramimonas_sp.AAC.2